MIRNTSQERHTAVRNEIDRDMVYVVIQKYLEWITIMLRGYSKETLRIIRVQMITV